MEAMMKNSEDMSVCWRSKAKMEKKINYQRISGEANGEENKSGNV